MARDQRLRSDRETVTGTDNAGELAAITDVLNGETGGAVAAEIVAAGGAATFVAANLMVDDGVDGLFDVITGQFGRLDIAFNNVGYSWGAGFAEAGFVTGCGMHASDSGIRSLQVMRSGDRLKTAAITLSGAMRLLPGLPPAMAALGAGSMPGSLCTCGNSADAR